MDGWMNEWMNEWMDGWMDEWMNEWMNGWMDGWISREINYKSQLDINRESHISSHLPRLNWNFEMLVFEEEGKPDIQENNPNGQPRNNNKLKDEFDLG